MLPNVQHELDTNHPQKVDFEGIDGPVSAFHSDTIIDDDEIGRRFSRLLLEKQAQGVQVHLIYDSFGTMFTPAGFFDRLKDGGIHAVEFNPINPLSENTKPWRINNRDHRKLLIVDGHTAFVGGINISKVYSSNPLSRRSEKKPDKASGWRDIHVRIEGPVVTEFQKLFVETWTKQQGPPLNQRNFFPQLVKQGEEIVRAIGSTASEPQSPVYLTLMSAISHAEREIHMTIAYFAPDKQFLKALIDAAQCGVEVQLILPSHTDSWLIFHLGRSYYSRLLRAGVTIYERRDAVMHSKTASIDGVWTTIGSTNMDWRSFLHNDEINAVILGRDFSRQMDAMFAGDLAASDKITLNNWKRRGLPSFFKERIARFAAYML